MRTSLANLSGPGPPAPRAERKASLSPIGFGELFLILFVLVMLVMIVVIVGLLLLRR